MASNLQSTNSRKRQPIKPSARALLEQQYGTADWKDTNQKTTKKTKITPPGGSVPRVEIPAGSNNNALISERKNDPVAVARNRALEAAKAEKAAFTRLQAQALEDMELYRTDYNERLSAIQRYQSYADKIAAADDVIRRAEQSAAQEKQYGITDWKDTKPQTAVKPETVPTVSARPEDKSEKRHWTKTVLDVAERGAGYGVQGISTAIDVAANALPIVEGWVFGVDKDATFTGQVLRPVTYLTGKFDDWIRATNANTQARIENDTRDSRVARIAADVGSGVVGALPSVALAVLSGGTSAAAQLGTQAAGISGTAVNAANAMLHNPVVQYNFATSLGNEYNTAKASGASDMDAMIAATVSGLFNAIVESGGVEALPKQLQGTDLSTAQKAWKWLISALSEGGEEPVQGLISEMTAKATYASDKPYFSITDENAVINPRRMGREFGYGTAIGGITGAVPMAGAAKKASQTKGIMEVVADTTRFDNDVLKNWSKARTQFIEYARENFPSAVVNEETGKIIGISRKGLDKFLSGRIPREKYASGFHIPELIVQAHYTGDATNYHQEKVSDIPTYEYYDSPIRIDGKMFTAHIRVRNTMSGDKYYGHTISEVDEIKIELSPTRTSADKTSTVQPVYNAADNSDISITDDVKVVNKGAVVEEDYLAFVRRLEEAQVMLETEELRQAYLRNIARLEEEKREAELDAAFWKYWD